MPEPNVIVALEHVILKLNKVYDTARGKALVRRIYAGDYVYYLGIQNACLNAIETAIEYEDIPLDFAEWTHIAYTEANMVAIKSKHTLDKSYHKGLATGYLKAMREYEINRSLLEG